VPHDGGADVKVAIIGAGIIGVAIAHALADAGHTITLVDPGGPAAGASRGNAGMIAHVDILPLASPKVWAHLPRWLADPLGPLAIRPAYLPHLAPWLLRFLAASRPSRIEHGTRALIALNGMALPAWERRLRALGLEAAFLRRRGFLSVWANARDFARAAPLLARQRSVGIPVDTLDAAAARRRQPALGPRVAGGAWYETGVNVADPRLLTLALAEAAEARQVRLVRRRAIAVAPAAAAVDVVLDGGERLAADRVVVAAGAWSRPLAASLGDRVPLDTERGYNVTFPSGRLGLTGPVVFEGEGFVATPLDTGDRVGGAVEFAGLQARPDFRRVDAILTRLASWLPDLDPRGGERWMGFRPSLPDSLPVIGPAPRDPRVLYAFGHAHHGLTEAAATAELIASLVAGEQPMIDVAAFRVGRF
jgi:D-amino-acid dehydrogenase